MARDILIVDDEADIRELVSGLLQDEGYETRLARDSDEALSEIRGRKPALMVLDIWLQGSRLDGLEVLEHVRSELPDLPVVIISGHGTIETAVAAIKMGAYDFIEKPFQADRLLLVVERALEAARLMRENEELRVRAGGAIELVGRSSAVNHLRLTVEKVAATGSRVLISGPSGSGKEVVARLLHASSRRRDNPFVVVNAATMAPERIEVELFGAEEQPGQRAKTGLFEQAHGGTLYIDEVADMPLETQGKILRVLVEQHFRRIGGERPIQVDVRVVSSSSRDLRGEIAARRFREDLFHRLAVVPIAVPSLAERREDIPLLAEHFMRRLSEAHGLPPRRLGMDTIAALQAYDWPGNVRQLRNIVERLLILATDDVSAVITADMLPSEVGTLSHAIHGNGREEQVMAMPLREAREVFEREYLLAQVNRFGGNISRTASFVGMERSALHRKLKSLGLNPNGKGMESGL
jgi:two-component system nitrogen regulation response regulator NtrX